MGWGHHQRPAGRIRGHWWWTFAEDPAASPPVALNMDVVQPRSLLAMSGN